MTDERIRPAEIARLHLPGRVPNEGARRLAWAIGSDWAATLGSLARAGVDRSMVDRLLTGELTPGQMVAWDIQAATRGAVLWDDWYRRARGAWCDPVPERRFHSEPRRAA